MILYILWLVNLVLKFVHFFLICPHKSRPVNEPTHSIACSNSARLSSDRNRARYYSARLVTVQARSINK
jgi:hypothetical protein